MDVASDLESWQDAGDPRLWKMIISPEFGERLDLQKLTRHVLAHMEKDLGTELQWVGVAHFNTEHPHVHVALRGIREDGGALDLKRDYIRRGIREIAEDGCTIQLGIRTEQDAVTAAEREIQQHRYTALDRSIRRLGTQNPTANPAVQGHFGIKVDVADRMSGSAARIERQHLAARLASLGKMGLAEQTDPDMWQVRNDFETVLRAMQRATDRQKVLAVHGALLSDERMRLVVTDARRIADLSGRVVGHGEEDEGFQNGRTYLLLEGTDGVVHMLYYTPEMDESRSRGYLRVNSFVQMRRRYIGGQPLLEVNDLGNAETVLKNKRHLLAVAQDRVKNKVHTDEGGWGGWLGRYQAALSEAVAEVRTKTIDSHRIHEPSQGR